MSPNVMFDATFVESYDSLFRQNVTFGCDIMFSLANAIMSELYELRVGDMPTIPSNAKPVASVILRNFKLCTQSNSFGAMHTVSSTKIPFKIAEP